MNRHGTILGAACVACLGSLLLGCSAPVETGAPVPTASALSFGSADGYYTLGRAEHAARHAPLAQRAYEEALRRDPAHRGARNGLAVLLAEAGDYAGAITLWRALLVESVDLPATEQGFLLGNLGYALYLKGEREQAATVLGLACLRDPLQPVAWEHLAAVLETLGQRERALQMMKQARMLRTHDLRSDYAAAGGTAPIAAAAIVDGATEPSLWPDDLARTEVRAVGAALVEVRRVPPRVQVPEALPAAMTARRVGAPAQSGLRLEISNGNGVRGMAGAWARDRHVSAIGWKSVRLTNTRPFAVPDTRIEYGAEGEAVARALSERLGLPAPRAAAGNAAADLRIVLGWDQRAATPLAPRNVTQAP